MTTRSRRPDLPPTRRGYQPHEVVSALQKAVRRSQVKQAVYWGFELWASGYDAWAWARVKEILSEDIGPADRYLPATIAAIEETSKHKKKTKNMGGMEFVHAVILLATAEKSSIACHMVLEADSDSHERLEIPDEAFDRHTRAGRQMGRGWEHFMEHGARLVQPYDRAANVGAGSVDAMLGQLETEAKDHSRRRWSGDPGLPVNPWAATGERGVAKSWLPAGQQDADPAPTLLDDPEDGGGS